MSSLCLFMIYVFILFFSTGSSQESNLVQDFDPPIDDQPPYFLSSDNLVSFQTAESSDPEGSSFTDMVGSGFGDSSLFTDVGISDFNNPMLSSSILEASCLNDATTRPGKLRAREGLSCPNPSASNQAVSKSKPATSNTGDVVGVMTSESNWCVDLQFALYHTVAVCDQLHTGVQQPSGFHSVVYPSSLSKFHIQTRTSCPIFILFHNNHLKKLKNKKEE